MTQIHYTPENQPNESESPGDGHSPVADGELHALDPRFINAERVGWWIFNGILFSGTVVFTVLMFLFKWFVPEVRWTIAGVLLLLVMVFVFLAIRQPKWIYDTTRYAVRPLGFEIRRGIFWKHIIDVPRSRIQHTDVMQGPVQRRFGIATITVHTAGTQYASVSLSGVEHRRALAMRDYLIRGGDDDDAV